MTHLDLIPGYKFDLVLEGRITGCRKSELFARLITQELEPIIESQT